MRVRNNTEIDDVVVEQAGYRNIGAGGNLQILWSPDDHASHYDAAWLRQNCYDDASRAARFQQPILWDAKLSERLPRVSYDKARNDDEGRLDLYRKLRDFGFVVITDGRSEPGSVEAVANLIGDMGESAYSRIFDLTPMSKTRTMGNTTRPVPPHTDEAFRHNPPGINILGCVKPADDGGDSVLVDGFKLASILLQEDPRSFSMLTDYAQSYHRVHDSGRGKAVDERTRQRMFVLDDRAQPGRGNSDNGFFQPAEPVDPAIGNIRAGRVLLFRCRRRTDHGRYPGRRRSALVV